MPQYMLLIYNPPMEGAPPPEMHQRWADYTQALKDAGLFRGGDALQRTDVATTVRERDGQIQITDGPFAETKEFLAGYYLLEAPDLDTVLEHAGRAPNLGHGAIEVRPIWDTGQATEATGQARAQA
ncbi:MAG: transcription initiation protein [Solirubrobacterales bacterium]|nr:transcription initiation protein [Solirubrobacterales bacterium]MBV9717202.1 transcription initiation protein [Solirubrobacterales bacterium]